jgi:hypothetical protein
LETPLTADLVERASLASFLRAAFFYLTVTGLWARMALAAWLASRPTSITEVAGLPWEVFLFLEMPFLPSFFKVMVKVLLKFLGVFSFLTVMPMVLADWEALLNPLVEKGEWLHCLPYHLVVWLLNLLVSPQITSVDLSDIVLLPAQFR